MLDIYLIKFLSYYTEIKISMSIIFGALIQFIFSENKNLSMFITIGASSVFVAMYIITPIIEINNLDINNQWVIALYAISSLISVPLLAIVLSVLPEAIKAKIKDKMGITK